MHPCEPRVGGNGACPAKVPGVTGMDEVGATAALNGAGFTVSVTYEATEDPAQNGLVLSAGPTGWQDPGTTVTIVVAQYSGDGGGDGDGGDGGGDGEDGGSDGGG